MSAGPTPGGVFREAALRAHLAGRASTTPEETGPGRVLIVLWVVALVLIAFAALVAA